MGHADKAKDINKQDKVLNNNISDVYICIFFDGTGNNMYEQFNKRDHLKKLYVEALSDHPTNILYSSSPALFSHPFDDFLIKQTSKDLYDLNQYGMTKYFEQKKQAEDKEFVISEESGSKESVDIKNNGGAKYSNVAILRSLLNKSIAEKDASYLTYNIYIEGSGKCWDKGIDLVGLGMGTGRTGVVGLVSKAIVFVREFLDSSINPNNRSAVNLHFAIFGFSRGSTCGRLFSYLVVDNPNNLPRVDEFKQYLPERYYQGNKLCFLDEYKNKTVDFLGIYDTVASIGFLQKDDNSTNYGMNQFVPFSYENGKTWYVNRMHGTPSTDAATIAISPSIVAGRNIFFGDAMYNFHRNNVSDYGLYSHHNEKVKHTFHICAMDEFRENFALVDLGSNLERCAEVFMPGCHSDIGGGIMKDDDIEKYTLRRTIDGKPTKMNSSSDPRTITPTTNLSKEVLSNMGWLKKANPSITSAPPAIISQGKSRTQAFMDTISQAMEPEDIAFSKALTKQLTEKNKKEENVKNGMEGDVTYIKENDKKIEFERFALEGYSNITLEMMIKRTLGHCGLQQWPQKPFSADLPPRFKVEKEELIKIRDEILKIDVNNIAEGKPTWFIPEPTDYTMLRKNYLHFSCTDELNIEKGHLSASGANLGNPPCWRQMYNEYYLLTRIVYKGDQYDNELHYINEHK